MNRQDAKNAKNFKELREALIELLRDRPEMLVVKPVRCNRQDAKNAKEKRI